MTEILRHTVVRTLTPRSDIHHREVPAGATGRVIETYPRTGDVLVDLMVSDEHGHWHAWLYYADGELEAV